LQQASLLQELTCHMDHTVLIATGRVDTPTFTLAN